MDTLRSQIETLVEDSQGNVNYVSWRFKLDLTLKSKGLYLVATGVELRPYGSDNDEVVKVWIKQDLEAQTIIGLNVSSNIARKIANCRSSFQMLEKLSNLFGKRSDLTVEGLQRQFFGYKYDESKSAIENCMQIQQYAEDLEMEGEEVKEGWVMTRILGMLPPKLHHFRTAWDNANAADKNLATLFERLRLEEDRLCQNGENASSQNAFMMKKVTQQPQINSSSIDCFKCGKKGHVKKFCKNKPCAKYLEYCKKNYSCNTCKQKGHFAKDCQKGKVSDRNVPRKEDNTNRRAFITVGLTSANMNSIKSKQNCHELWYQDCAATQHMTSRKDWMVNFSEYEDSVKIVIGDATQIEGVGAGDIELEAYNGNEWLPIVLKNVLYVPKITFNLFSVSQMLDKGYLQYADSLQSTFKSVKENKNVAVAEREGNLFRMMFRRDNDECANLNKCLLNASIKIWHERLAHQNIRYVRDILKRAGIEYVDDWNDYICEGCTYGKQHRVAHPINEKVSSNILDIVHVDLCEMNIRSLGGAKYFLLFKDDFSHFRTVYFLKSKDEAPQKLKLFLKIVENQFGSKIKCLKSDNGTEIKNVDTKTLLEENGILHIKTNVYTPEQNGRIEREMRTVVEAARSAIHANNLNENLWAEAINYAVFTINQTGKSSVSEKTPADLWFGRKINVNKLKSFGSDCYVLLHNHQRFKTEKKSKKGIFVGYDLDTPCYRIFIPEKNDVVSSDNVVFDEKVCSKKVVNEVYLPLTGNQRQNLVQPDESKGENSDDSEDSRYLEPEEYDRQEEKRENSPINLRERRNLKRPVKFKDYLLDDSLEDVAMIGEVEDISIAEALKDKNWQQAMTDEYKSLIDMRTWDLVEKPKDVRPLTCRWVLRQKQDGKFKARLVARGFEQKYGIDYSETFSPVARYVSIRLIFSLAASNKMKLMTFDVKTAFLHGDLQEEIFMHQPEGFEDKTDRVCKLNKSIYGLKQAPKTWNEKFSSFVKSLGFCNTDDDPCVYYNENRTVILALFVDDGILAGYDEIEMIDILNKLKLTFEITFDVAENGSFCYLGMQVKYDSNGIFVNQPKYTEKILKRFSFDLTNHTFTPIEKGMLTNKENFVNDSALPKSEPYREAIGSLLYLATLTRPDINFAVNYLSRFTSSPMVSHWKMVKRIFQYLKGTIEYGIFFNPDERLVAYTDSDYGGDLATRQSTSGILILRGGPIVWSTQKQRVVATSSAEAEYRAAVSAIDDICWIRRIGGELDFLDTNQPTLLCIDNQSAIHMLQNVHEGKITKGKKHIEISRKFIQDHIGKTVELKHVSSSNQLADILTKPLCRTNFENLRFKSKVMIKEEC